MAILLAFLIGAAVGVIAHIVLPGRDLRGLLLLPMLGTVLGGVAWLACTLLGMGVADLWPWLLSVLVPVAGVVPAGLLLTRLRTARDARERARLKLG